MSRWEFMRQLEELLSDISPNEREEALQYYNDYFNDAGRENEQEVIAALGSPQQVAEIVREGLDDGGSQGEFTENGFSSGRKSPENEIIKREASSGSRTTESDGQGTGSFSGTQSGSRGAGAQTKAGAQNTGTYSQKRADSQNTGSFRQSEGAYQGAAASHTKKELPVWAIVLIAVGAVFAAPVILGAVVSLLGAVLGFLCAVVCIIFGVGLAAVTLFVVAVSLLVAGFGCMFSHPLAAVGLLGGGLICGALGMLFLLFTVFLVGKGIPALYKGVTYLYHRISDRWKGAAA